MKFINHSEGYIEPDGGGGYDYVYQYKDHLGNIRLSYSDTNKDGTVDVSEIIEESNYYPFGLKHRGCGGQVNGAHHNWDFQGQERTEDLELNVLEFKYRIHDPAIGRFWQIDPLAEKYAYNGTYNFAENKVIQFNELEGLEVGTPAFYVEVAAKTAQKVKSFFSGTEKVATGTADAFNSAASGDSAIRQAAEAKNNTNGSESTADPNVQLIMEGAAQIDNAIPDAPTVREIADGAEVIGDAMVVGAPATGPYAPAVGGIGEIISTGGTVTNVVLDLAEGDVKSAATRVVIEGISGGLSSIARQSPHIEELAEQIIDANIVIYENITESMIDHQKNKPDDKQE